MIIYDIKLLLIIFVTLQLDVKLLKTMTHHLSCGPSRALGFINKNSSRNKKTAALSCPRPYQFHGY